MTKTLLNTMCAPHDNSSTTPPQEQGMSLPDNNITAIYIVNADINMADEYNPANRDAGITSIRAMSNSLAGITQTSILAKGAINGDSVSPKWKL